MECLVHVIQRHTPAEIEAMQEVADAPGPEVREVNEVGSQCRAELPEDKCTRASLKALDDPSNQILEKPFCIFFRQHRTNNTISNS